MSRAPREHVLESFTARSKLKSRKEPYWRQVTTGTFLGLAKGKRASAWIARQRSGDGYISRRVGIPDDHVKADGVVVLSYRQAVTKAADVQLAERAPAPRHLADGLTLDQAISVYLEARETTPGGRTGRRMKKSSADMASSLWKRHGSESIGGKLITGLDAPRLRKWHAAMASTPPTKRGKVMPFDPEDLDQVAARQSSANRVLTICKAALQHARIAELLPATLPDFWRNVAPFKNDRDAVPRMLEQSEITRLLNAAAGDLRELLMAGLMTGARYGELAALKVGDYSDETATVRIAQGKSGKVLQQPLTGEGREFFARITAGRPAGDTMIVRPGGMPWGKSHASRPVKAAAATAKVDGMSFKTMRATYGKLLLLATRDIELVAKALGHSDSRITRKHYAQYLPGELARGVERMPRIGIETKSKVRKIR